MTHGIETFVKLAPAEWPGGAPRVEPGDLSLIAPMGSGLGMPMVMRPWDTPEGIVSRGAYYAHHAHSSHPFAGAPMTEASGGVLYFNHGRQREDIEAMCRLMGVKWHGTDYAAFAREAEGPEDRYIIQMRIVSSFAMRFFYRVPESPEGAELQQQPHPVTEVLWRFVEWSQQEYEADRDSIEGLLGGDGDFAQERLGFGFMVENQYHGIYRIWTRAWLITK